MSRLKLSTAAGSAFSNGARLVPRKMLEPEANEIQERICELAAMMFGIAEHCRTRSRTSLMGAFGGCGLRIDSVRLAADVAFWSWLHHQG